MPPDNDAQPESPVGSREGQAGPPSGQPLGSAPQEPTIVIEMGSPHHGSAEAADEAREARATQHRAGQQATSNRSGAAPGASYFGSLYVGAAVVGVLPLFLTHGLWWLPWVIMVGYGFAGYSRAESTGTLFEFADSIYYLGFTFSVGALLASLDPFNGVG